MEPVFFYLLCKETVFHFLALQCLWNKVPMWRPLCERWGWSDQHSPCWIHTSLICARIVLKVSTTKIETFILLQVSGSSAMLHKLIYYHINFLKNVIIMNSCPFKVRRLLILPPLLQWLWGCVYRWCWDAIHWSLETYMQRPGALLLSPHYLRL